MPFAAMAWLGNRASPLWLAIGWATHVAWDVGLHLGTGAPAFVPAFFPTFCVGFDLAIAVSVLSYRYFRSRSATPAGRVY